MRRERSEPTLLVFCYAPHIFASPTDMVAAPHFYQACLDGLARKPPLAYPQDSLGLQCAVLGCNALSWAVRQPAPWIRPCAPSPIFTRVRFSGLGWCCVPTNGPVDCCQAQCGCSLTHLARIKSASKIFGEKLSRGTGVSTRQPQFYKL